MKFKELEQFELKDLQNGQGIEYDRRKQLNSYPYASSVGISYGSIYQ